MDEKKHKHIDIFHSLVDDISKTKKEISNTSLTK